MKRLMTTLATLCPGNAVFAQRPTLPGIPATEQVTVTPIDAGSGVTARAWHPRADNYCLRRSQATKIAFSAIENIYLQMQSVLLVAGGKADSDWQMQRLYDAQHGSDKEMFVVGGASHIGLYAHPDHVARAAGQLNDFFCTDIGWPRLTAARTIKPYRS